VGIVDVVLGSRRLDPSRSWSGWLEYRLEGEFSLVRQAAAAFRSRRWADRIDLLADRRLRVIDYKSGYAPQPKRALQVPSYALCAQERLTDQRDGDWTVDEASYVALPGSDRSSR
jgi:RecB family exonuclease